MMAVRPIEEQEWGVEAMEAEWEPFAREAQKIGRFVFAMRSVEGTDPLAVQEIVTPMCPRSAPATGRSKKLTRSYTWIARSRELKTLQKCWSSWWERKG